MCLRECARLECHLLASCTQLLSLQNSFLVHFVALHPPSHDTVPTWVSQRSLIADTAEKGMDCSPLLIDKFLILTIE